MPINSDNKYFDFEELFFEKNSDIDFIIDGFFNKYQNSIKGNTQLISHQIKKLIIHDRNLLNNIKPNPFNFIGKTSYIKHYVIPDHNDGKKFYVYSINSFI
jgi:hypothetical protein